MTNYPDYGSPVRKAREMARAALPCESCGAGGEPVIRRPRPYSSGESAKAGAFFACPECGHRLSELRGAAADRLSDVPEDNLPDPAGMLARRIQPLVGEARPGDRAKVLAQAVTDLAREHGLGCRTDGEFVLIWRGEPWLELGLEGDRVVILPG